MFQIYYDNPKTKKSKNKTSLKSFWPKIHFELQHLYQGGGNNVEQGFSSKETTQGHRADWSHHPSGWKSNLQTTCTTMHRTDHTHPIQETSATSIHTRDITPRHMPLPHTQMTATKWILHRSTIHRATPAHNCHPCSHGYANMSLTVSGMYTCT